MKIFSEVKAVGSAFLVVATRWSQPYAFR